MMGLVDYQKLQDWQNIPQLKGLLDLPTPPKELFYTGNFNPAIFEDCVAVVGSRKMTDYGQRVIEKMIPQLVGQGQTIVSGFMYGVDQYAHQTTVEGGGKTVAVLGWGIDTKLTGSDLRLAKQIISSGGLIVSEWQSQRPTHWTFPVRNRIVAGLCREVIVVEAAKISGSLITARIAYGLKRQLSAVPGPITSKQSTGTNNLIASGKAKIWLGEANQAKPISSEDPILQILDNETLGADELARKMKTPISEVGAALSLLLLSGQVLEKGGKYYLADVN